MLDKKNKKYLYGLVAASLLIAAFVYLQNGAASPAGDNLGYFEATINYEPDGNPLTPDSYVIKPSGAPTMQVLDPNSGRVVKSITVALYVHPVFSGQVSSWSVATKTSAHVYNSANVYQFQYTAPTSVSASGASLTSDVDVPVAVSTADIAYLDTQMYGKASGNYYLGMALNEPLKMTLNFVGGTSQTLSSETASSFYWSFKYQEGTFYSLGVSWGIQPSF